jgi:hypothetical protein
MRKYVFAALIFAVPLGIDSFIVSKSKETGTGYRNSWPAAHPIGPNHQSQPDDLHVPSDPAAALRLLLYDQHLTGNHLRGGERETGAALSDSDLAERPDLSSAAKGSQIYVYVVKEDAGRIGGWTEGAAGIPCFPKAVAKQADKAITTCIQTPLRILAIYKLRATGEASCLALEIP